MAPWVAGAHGASTWSECRSGYQQLDWDHMLEGLCAWVPASRETQASDSKCQAEAGGTRGQTTVPMVQRLKLVWVNE